MDVGHPAAAADRGGGAMIVVFSALLPTLVTGVLLYATRAGWRCAAGWHALTWASPYFATCQRCERHFRVQS